jgi:hypothetical protein
VRVRQLAAQGREDLVELPTELCSDSGGVQFELNEAKQQVCWQAGLGDQQQKKGNAQLPAALEACA